ncbi:unnamed protein product [Adineta ricciae]|uniref:Sialate O-acetylesterase domain-containing protein n=2 Tax=Adineta ricciae TaxID=249248 RepID=A0A815N605_ADIRI|nr:unnamed protein product [Adineta ricciae]
MKAWYLFLLLLSYVIESHGQLRFANYFSDNMVLQRAPQRAIVWGYGDTDVITTLTMNNKVYKTRSESKINEKVGASIWSVTLDAESDEGPFEVVVTQPLANGTLSSIALKNVLYGDIWVCSGQSNMQWAVSQVFNGSTEIANAGNYPKIRLFGVARVGAAAPVEEIPSIGMKWSVASSSVVGNGYASAVCWMYGRMIHTALNGRPIGLINTSWGGTAIELWMPRQALTDCGITKKKKPKKDIDEFEGLEKVSATNTELYNGMIYPFTRMVVTGAIWYQGESNSGYNRDKYICTFSKMITYWRQVWNTRTNGITNLQFPFGFVQLSTNRNSTSFVGGFPWIRWYQTFGIGYVPNNVVPNVFMAAAMDLRDDPGGIHPRTKTDVAYRLSRAGLAVAYGQQVEYQGPIVSNVVVSSASSTIEVSYTNVTAIEFRNPNGFEVCCQGTTCATNDNAWLLVTASSKSSLSVSLSIPSSCASSTIYGIRYLWRETPCDFKQAAVYSATDANLPSPPYLKVF